MGVFLFLLFVDVKKEEKYMCSPNGMRYGWYRHCRSYTEKDDRYFCVRFDREAYNKLFDYDHKNVFCQFISDFLEKRGFTGNRGSLMSNPEIYVNFNNRHFFFGMSHSDSDCKLPMIGNKPISFNEFLTILDIFDRKTE